MRRNSVFALALFFAATAAFAERVTNAFPLSGTVGGGDVVTITLADVPFPCDPCVHTVSFGGTAPRATLPPDSDNTVRVITPAHEVGTVDLTVDGILAGKFQFLDLNGVPNLSNYEVVLIPVPVQLGTIPGAFSSQWTSELWAYNRSDNRVELFAGEPVCMALSPIGCHNFPFPGLTSNTAMSLGATGNGASAFLYYLQRGGANQVSFSLRIRDVSRSSENSGTEIPLGRESAFRTDRVELLNVPVEDSARTSLRVYNIEGAVSSTADVRIFTMDGNAVASKTVTLTAPPALVTGHGFPAYAGVAFISDLRSEFPQLANGRYRIEVAPSNGFRAWALATMANNTTQLVTAIAP